MDTLINLLESLITSDGSVAIPLLVVVVLVLIAYHKWIKPFLMNLLDSVKDVKSTKEMIKNSRKDDVGRAIQVDEVHALLIQQQEVIELQLKDLEDIKKTVQDISGSLDTDNKDINKKLQDIIFELNKLSIHTELGLRGIK